VELDPVWYPPATSSQWRPPGIMQDPPGSPEIVELDPVWYPPATSSQWPPPGNVQEVGSARPPEVEIDEAGPSTRPPRYAAASGSQWRLPVPPASSSSSGASGGGGAAAQGFDSERLPPTLVQEVQPVLRVANLIDGETPRVAYLCKFAFLPSVQQCLFLIVGVVGRSLCIITPPGRSRGASAPSFLRRGSDRSR
jgi:hypothetical protein